MRRGDQREPSTVSGGDLPQCSSVTGRRGKITRHTLPVTHMHINTECACCTQTQTVQHRNTQRHSAISGIGWKTNGPLKEIVMLLLLSLYCSGLNSERSNCTTAAVRARVSTATHDVNTRIPPHTRCLLLAAALPGGGILSGRCKAGENVGGRPREGRADEFIGNLMKFRGI